jgi:hypothetical protein
MSIFYYFSGTGSSTFVSPPYPMKNMKTLLSHVLLLSLFGTAKGQTTKNSSEEKAVLKVLEGTVEAWNKHDT